MVVITLYLSGRLILYIFGNDTFQASNIIIVTALLKVNFKLI